MIFEIIGKPLGKQRPRIGKNGAYTPQQTVNYENYIRWSFMRAFKGILDLYDKQITMRVKAIYAVPKSFTKTQIESALRGQIRPQIKPDIDNVIKAVCDALNGLAYKDDSQIVELHSIKEYGAEPKLIIQIVECKE